MSPTIRSNLIAGVIATVIYIVIAMATGQDAGPAIGFGLLLGAATFVVAFLISRVFGPRRRGDTAP